MVPSQLPSHLTGRALVFMRAGRATTPVAQKVLRSPQLLDGRLTGRLLVLEESSNLFVLDDENLLK